jgi:hypothetical protein
MAPVNSRIACWPFVTEYKLHKGRSSSSADSAHAGTSIDAHALANLQYAERDSFATGNAPIELGFPIGSNPCLFMTRQPSFEAALECVSIKWNHLIDKDSLKIKELEHVLSEKVEQLFGTCSCE